MKNPQKILLVTADDNLVCYFKKALNRYDVVLSVENNYNKAIETIQQDKFDLIVTDYFLFADGNDEAFESFTLEVETLDNDLRLLTPLRESLIRLRSLIYEKNKEKLFPLGNRLAVEAGLFGTNVLFLLNFIDPTVYECDMKEYLDDLAEYYNRYGRPVFYSPLGFKEKLVNDFIKEDIVDVMKISKI